MVVGAGQKGVARGQPMHEPVLHEIIERAIDGNGRRTTAVRAHQPVDHFICAQRLPGGAEHVQDRLAAGGQIQPGHMVAMTLAIGVVMGGVVRPAGAPLSGMGFSRVHARNIGVVACGR